MEKIAKNKLLKDIEFIVLDFETTGLNYKKDKIISMGFVLIKNLTIDLNSTKHIIINPKDNLEKSVIIHKITDDEVANGISITNAMEELIQIMTNKILIVHFAGIEKNFIQYICNILYQVKLPLRILDTLQIQMKKDRLLNNKADSFRLFNLRQKYNLPRYKAHNALIDAIATAELFLAQISYNKDLNKIKLKDVL